MEAKMGNKKSVFKIFTICQYQQEEEYLSSMHEKGWALKKVTFPGFYHFEKCEPGRKVTYRLDYNQEGIKNKSEYITLFSDCGWEYLFDMVGYSYFRKESDGSQEREEIFCDDSSRLDMMKRVFKGRIIPLIILFVCCILPQFFLHVQGYGGGGIVQETLSVTLMILAFVYLLIFSASAYQFYLYEKRVLPEKAGVTYKYCGIAVLILSMLLCIGTCFYLSKRSVYSVSERAAGFTIEAEQLNGSVVMEYDLKKGDCIAVETSGYDGLALYICIGEENKEPAFFGNSYGEMGDFTVEIMEDGHYQIECSGRKGKGVIAFDIK